MDLTAILRSAEPDAGGLVWFRATSEARDRHGTVIESAGVDVEPFLRNPVVGWGHRAVRGGDPDDVLGRVDAIERGADYIDVGVRFADHERAQLVGQLVRDGFLSAMSVGILPRRKGTRRINGASVPVIRESELLEVSIVPVGSNPEAQRLLRDLMGAEPEETEMNTETLTRAIEDAVRPLGERLDAIEQTLDEPERVPALGGARTSEDVDALAGRWLKARAFNDQRTLLELAESDPAPEAEVRDMLSADSYLPTAVSSRLITLVGEASKFLRRAGSVTDSALSVQLPRESTKLSAGFVAENTSVILGGAALDSVTLTARNAWAGERVPNRVLADQPVNTAAMLLRQAADALAAHFDTVFVEGTASLAAIDVTSGLLDVTPDAILHVDAPADAGTAVAKVSAEYFALVEQARRRAVWVTNATYAQNLSELLDSQSRPVFGMANSPPSASIDGASDSTLFGRPVIVHSSVPADTAFFGDLSRAVMVYRRQGIVAESSRDAEFSLDNTLFRFGWRFDVAVVEEGQIEHFPAA